MSHTKEPWSASTFTYFPARIAGHRNDGESTFIADCASHEGASGANEEDKANTRRIIACVNACAGIGTEYLEKFGGTTFNDFKRVKRQRDELLAALKGLFNEFGELSYDIADLDRCRAAIAKATGELHAKAEGK